MTSPSKLKPPSHQVGGHEATSTQLGPLIDDSGLFYKPLQTSDDRGTNEVTFYTSFSLDPRVPHSIRNRFFPSFHGTQLLHTPLSPSLHPHLILEDLVSSFTRPSLIDIKIGSRTWYPNCSTEYLTKCLKKDMETTSVLLGFRISGLQTQNWKPERNAVKGFKTAEDVRTTLRRFVSTNEVDCEMAGKVYGGSDGVLAQLLELKAWFEDQTVYHFYSSSVLVIYEEGGSGARVKLVDFAHVREGGGVIDHNFLGGLCSLIKFVSEILTDPRDEEGKKVKLAMENGS